jgi:hypothetical protein
MQNRQEDQRGEEGERDHHKEMRKARYRSYWFWKILKQCLLDIYWDFRIEVKRVRFVVEFLGVVILLAYTVYTALMYRATRDAANAALQAASTSAKQLEATDRPWVKVELSPPNVQTAAPRDLVFDDEGTGAMTIEISLINIGRSIANHVSVRVEAFAISPSDDARVIIKARQRDLCGTPDTAIAIQHAIFPQDAAQDFNYVGFRTREIQAPNWFTTHYTRGKAVFAFIYGCVDYRSVSPATHQTGFVFQIYAGEGATLQAGNTIPWNHLTFRREESFEGNYAY